jgi:hypothetical protein
LLPMITLTWIFDEAGVEEGRSPNFAADIDRRKVEDQNNSQVTAFKTIFKSLLLNWKRG